MAWSLGLWPDRYIPWVSLSSLLEDSRTREEARVPADPELFCCQALGSLPCLEKEEAELWERFLVNIGEDWDWYLEFTWDCWVLLGLPLPLPPLPPLLLSVLCSMVPVGVPLPKQRGLGEWSGPPVDDPDAGSSAFSRIEESVL